MPLSRLVVASYVQVFPAVDEGAKEVGDNCKYATVFICLCAARDKRNFITFCPLSRILVTCLTNSLPAGTAHAAN